MKASIKNVWMVMSAKGTNEAHRGTIIKKGRDGDCDNTTQRRTAEKNPTLFWQSLRKVVGP